MPAAMRPMPAPIRAARDARANSTDTTGASTATMIAYQEME